MSSDLILRNTAHPVIYEVNARLFLRELAVKLGRPVTFATVPDEILDEWAESGFDAIWFMGVWTTGKIGLEIARSVSALTDEYHRVLPDVREEDIIGSPYAVKSYAVARELGGNFSLGSIRKRLAQRGIAVILDFVVNHSARDCKWVEEHPEYYVSGDEHSDIEQPDYYFRSGKNVIAYGRDPYFPGWTDTAQLNYCNPALREAMIENLLRIAEMSDGVRCDMAMLVLNSVFLKTWGDRVAGSPTPDTEFWSEAIARVHAVNPRFTFIAEAYWDLEWNLQQLGFDFTYDKKLYDRLLREGAGSVFDHLKAEPDYQRKSVRFIENHDEPRAAEALSSEPWQFAAATIIATIPGMLLLHDGQLDGLRAKLPVQLGRRPAEPTSPHVRAFYKRLLSCISSPGIRRGTWQLLEARAAWSENYTWGNFLVFWWREESSGYRLIVVNYAPHNGQCYVTLPLEERAWQSVGFRDLLGDAFFVRERNPLTSRGMYFDLSPYGLHFFEVKEAAK
jgi:Alpha amylase, catalytic domain